MKTAKSKPKLATAAGSQAPRQGACQPRGAACRSSRTSWKNSSQTTQDVRERCSTIIWDRITSFRDVLRRFAKIPPGRPGRAAGPPPRARSAPRPPPPPPGACHTGLGKCGLGIYPNACFCIFPRGFRRRSHASAAKQVIKPRLYNANFQSRRGPGAPTPHESLQIAYSLFT